MALDWKPRYSEFADSSKIVAADYTGLYGTSNTGGFGTPNMAVSDASSCIVEVTKPDPITLLPSTDPAMTIVIDMFGTLPNTDGTTFNILATALGYTDGKLQMGRYKLVSRLESESLSLSYSVTGYLMVMNSVNCCIEKMMLNTDINECCDCFKADSIASNVRLGKSYLWGALAANKHDYGNKAAEFLKRAIEICNGCKQCNC